MVRRLLLLASMVVLLWAAPAHAQTYGGILGEDQGKNGNVVVNTRAGQAPAQVKGAVFEAPAGGLARTGQDNVVPLIQFAIVLMGAGTLLVVAARRRRSVHSPGI